MTEENLFIIEDFFSWLLTCKNRDLQIKSYQKLESLSNLVSISDDWKFELIIYSFQSIYQSWLERTCLEFGDIKLRLRFDTENGLQDLVKGVRLPWERSKGIKLEVSQLLFYCVTINFTDYSY